MSLAELFPDEDFRFRLTLRRGEASAFFGVGRSDPGALAERRRWLAEPGDRYLGVRPAGEMLVAELTALAAGWGAITPLPPPANSTSATTAEQPRGATAVKSVAAPSRPAAEPHSRAQLAAVSVQLEPDLLLLAREPSGEFHLQAGALCFPTAWALEEKLGRPLTAIHGPVPGLNGQLAPSVDRVLGTLRPGSAVLRDNWGLAATDARNLHPALGRKRITAPLAPAQIWLRVERQALVALPATRGVLFGLRIELHPLTRVLAEPAAACGLRRALATMPEQIAHYKGVAAVRHELVGLLS